MFVFSAFFLTVLCPDVQAVSLPRSSVVWEMGAVTRVLVASVVGASLRLVRGDGLPADTAAEAVEARAVVSRGEAAGAGGGAGGDTTLPVTLAPVCWGVYRLSIAVPADVVGCTLALHVHVRGVGDVGVPLEVECTPLVFDPAAGDPAHRTICDDGTTLVVTEYGHLFRGRTPLLHTGPGVSLDIGLVLRLGGSGSQFIIALGGVDHIIVNTYGSVSNTGLAFFWNVYHGGVNVNGASTGHTRYAGAGTLVCHFRIRGNTLTFAAGRGCRVEQPGSWTLPNDFYLLISGSPSSGENVVQLLSQ